MNSGRGFAPALDSFWQVSNRLLERRLLRLLWLLSGSGLSDDCFRLLHFAEAITEGMLCRHIGGGFGVDRLWRFCISGNGRRLRSLHGRRCNRGAVFDAALIFPAH